MENDFPSPQFSILHSTFSIFNSTFAIPSVLLRSTYQSGEAYHDRNKQLFQQRQSTKPLDPAGKRFNATTTQSEPKDDEKYSKAK